MRRVATLQPMRQAAEREEKDMKKEYYGLKNNELLGYNFGRQETYFFRIYNDGSSTVMIRTKENNVYTFGSIAHCRRLYKNGYSFTNTNGKEYILLKKFKNAICA